jgi:hypothetical protein
MKSEGRGKRADVRYLRSHDRGQSLDIQAKEEEKEGGK